MNRGMILAEWRRAQEAVRAVELLTSEECYADAVSRTYYAVLHAAKAALHEQEIIAVTHSAVCRMFGLHLIKTGEIEKEYAVRLGESFDDQLSADYDAEVTFSRKDARRECRQTRRFLSRIRRFLRPKRSTASELRGKAGHGTEREKSANFDREEGATRCRSGSDRGTGAHAERSRRGDFFAEQL